MAALGEPDDRIEHQLRIQIAHSFYRIPGGEDRYVRQQLGLLSTRHAVDLIEERNEELSSGLGTGLRMTWSSKENDKIYNRVKSHKPNLLHLHNAYPSLGPSVHLAARRLRVPLVMTVHNFRLRCPNGYMFTEGESCRRCERGVYPHAVVHRCFPDRRQAAAYASALWLHRFVGRLERDIALFIAPSTFMRDRLLDWGISPERTAMIPNFVEVRPDASSRVGEVGLYVGRLSTEKGLDVLLEALKLAGDPPFRIVGDGPMGDWLRGRAEELRLTKTDFLGRLSPESVARLLSDARFLVMPSVWDENCPLAVLEAMATGRPLLVTDRGGLPELAAEGRGLLCEAGDAEAMADKLQTLMTDPEWCAVAGERCLDYARAHLTPGSHLLRLEEAYDRCLSEDVA